MIILRPNVTKPLRLSLYLSVVSPLDPHPYILIHHINVTSRPTHSSPSTYLTGSYFTISPHKNMMYCSGGGGWLDQRWKRVP